MTEYRNEAREFHREARWIFWKFLPLMIVVLAVLAGLGFGLRSLGLWGGTVIERKVFEESYQRSESIKAQIATDEAVIVQIEGQLTNPELDQETRINLKAQLLAAKLRISIAEGRQ